mgnify:CR=1 FL=1
MSERRETTYGPEDLRDWDPDAALGVAGSYPYTRGPYPSMYTGRLWTMRQYAGFGDAGATNLRFRTLLHAGQTGLSVAFDLPTQMGLDSDDPMAEGEVGRVGMAVDTLEDMDGIERIDTVRAINLEDERGPVQLLAVNNPTSGEARLYLSMAGDSPTETWEMVENGAADGISANGACGK